MSAFAKAFYAPRGVITSKVQGQLQGGNHNQGTHRQTAIRTSVVSGNELNFDVCNYFSVVNLLCNIVRWPTVGQIMLGHTICVYLTMM